MKRTEPSAYQSFGGSSGRNCTGRFERLARIIPKDRPLSILDVGSNMGYFSLRLAEEYPSVVFSLEAEHKDYRFHALQATAHGLTNNYIARCYISRETALDIQASREVFDVTLLLSIVHHFRYPFEQWCGMVGAFICRSALTFIEIPRREEGSGISNIEQWRTWYAQFGDDCYREIVLAALNHVGLQDCTVEEIGNHETTTCATDERPFFVVTNPHIRGHDRRHHFESVRRLRNVEFILPDIGHRRIADVHAVLGGDIARDPGGVVARGKALLNRLANKARRTIAARHQHTEPGDSTGPVIEVARVLYGPQTKVFEIAKGAYRLCLGDRGHRILKLTNAKGAPRVGDEAAALRFLHVRGFHVPDVDFTTTDLSNAQGLKFVSMSDLGERFVANIAERRHRDGYLRELGRTLGTIEQIRGEEMPVIPSPSLSYDFEKVDWSALGSFPNAAVLVPRIIARYGALRAESSVGLCHGDMHLAHAVVNRGKVYLIDFGDVGLHVHGWDLACLLVSLSANSTQKARDRAAILDGYEEVRGRRPETAAVLDTLERYRALYLARCYSRAHDDSTARHCYSLATSGMDIPEAAEQPVASLPA